MSSKINTANHTPTFIYALISDMCLTASVCDCKTICAYIFLYMWICAYTDKWYVPNSMRVWYYQIHEASTQVPFCSPIFIWLGKAPSQSQPCCCSCGWLLPLRPELKGRDLNGRCLDRSAFDTIPSPSLSKNCSGKLSGKKKKKASGSPEILLHVYNLLLHAGVWGCMAG